MPESIHIWLLIYRLKNDLYVYFILYNLHQSGINICTKKCMRSQLILYRGVRSKYVMPWAAMADCANTSLPGLSHINQSWQKFEKVEFPKIYFGQHFSLESHSRKFPICADAHRCAADNIGAWPSAIPSFHTKVKFQLWPNLEHPINWSTTEFDLLIE